MTDWWRIRVVSPSDEWTGLFAEGLVACGGSAVQERGDTVETWIARADSDEEVESVRARLSAQLQEMTGVSAADILVEPAPDEDWLALWRAGLEPRRIPPHIIVSPTWSEVIADPDDIVIRIDPQMAFGTGEHASTRGVLRLMQRVVSKGDWLLDVGAGSAILAIAAARLGAAHVLAVESDPDAIENATENIERNDVSAAVTLRCALVDAAFLHECGADAFDGILANVISGVLRPLLREFYAVLEHDGWAILSGILLEEADTMRAAAIDAGFTVEAEDAEEQWWSVLLRRNA